RARPGRARGRVCRRRAQPAVLADRGGREGQRAGRPDHRRQDPGAGAMTATRSDADRGANRAMISAELDKRYGPTVVLTRARLAVRRGTVHALVGENGAGKSTL